MFQHFCLFAVKSVLQQSFQHREYQIAYLLLLLRSSFVKFQVNLVPIICGEPGTKVGTPKKASGISGAGNKLFVEHIVAPNG